VEPRADPPFDVCLSFAGSEREYVREVDRALQERGLQCFFDERNQAGLWGQDLAEKFDEIFREKAAYCVAFISKEWVERTWPTHERRSALARALVDSGYFLPVRFDDTPVPGLRPTVGYIEAASTTPELLADLITQKVTWRQRHAYVPPYPDRVFAALYVGADDAVEKERVVQLAHSVLSELKDMSDEERAVILAMLRYGCPCSLPEELHIRLDRLCRVAKIGRAVVERTLASIHALGGLSGEIKEDEEGCTIVSVQWIDLAVGGPGGSMLGVASALVSEAGTEVCDHCYGAALERLDFSRASSLLDYRSEHRASWDPESCPVHLRAAAHAAAAAGWEMELVSTQFRLRPAGARDFIATPLPVHEDEECAQREYEELLAELLRAGLAVSAGSSTTAPS